MQPFNWRICRLVAMRLLTHFVLPYYARREITAKPSNDN